MNENLGINWSALLKPDDPSIQAFIWILVIITVIAGSTITFDWWRANRAIRTSRKIFESSSDGEPNAYLWQQALTEQASKAKKTSSIPFGIRQGTQVAVDQWREFKETLVFSPDTIRNTIPANYFFSTQSFAPNLSANRLLHAVPATLTGIGLLGTFIGLTSGLSGLDLSSDSTDRIQAGIGQLVASASLGFSSSVWGIFLSIVVTAVMRMAERNVSAKARSLANDIDEALVFQTAERSLAEIERHSLDSAGALNELHEKIGTSLQEAIQGMSNELQEALSSAITSSITPVMESITDRSMNQSHEVFTQLVEKFAAAFTDMGERQAKELKSASDAINTSLNKVSKDLDHILGSLHEALQEQANAHTQQLQELTSMLEMVTTTANNAIEAVQQTALHMENMGDKLQAGAQSLETASTQLGQTATEFSNQKESLSHALTLATDALNATQENQRSIEETLRLQLQRSNELFNSSQKMSAQLTYAFNLLVSTFPKLEEQQNQFLQGLRSEYASVQTAMENYLNEYSNQVRLQTHQRLEEFNSATQQYAGHMFKVGEGLTAITDSLEEKLEAIQNSTPTG